MGADEVENMFVSSKLWKSWETLRRGGYTRADRI